MADQREARMLTCQEAAIAWRDLGFTEAAELFEREAVKIANEIQAADHDICGSCGSLYPRKTQDAGR